MIELIEAMDPIEVFGWGVACGIFGTTILNAISFAVGRRRR